MLDLIIPVYKNIPGLYRSLFSIGTETGKRVFVTIVDDCSGDNYDEIVKFFQKFFPIRVIYLPENSGPGIARQVGLSQATQKYVSFLDCGDTFISPTRLIECLNEIEDNPEIYMFSYVHKEERMGEDGRFWYSDTGPQNNRMHGKFYRRDFLVRHNIRFSEECPRMNEDIGFNISARLVAISQSRADNIDRIFHSDNPVVVWKCTGPSIVRAENHAFYYRDQNNGMSYNGEHVLKLAKENNVEEDLIVSEVYEEMVHMYAFHFAARNDRPEFLEQSLNGATRYYWRCFRPYGDKDPALLKNIYWNTMSNFISDPNDSIRTVMSVLDFPGFLNLLEERGKEQYGDQTVNLESITDDNGFNYVAN